MMHMVGTHTSKIKQRERKTLLRSKGSPELHISMPKIE